MKHFDICTAKQGEGGVFTFLETGSSFYTQTNKIPGQMEQLQMQQEQPRIQKKEEDLENSFKHHRDFKKS